MSEDIDGICRDAFRWHGILPDAVWGMTPGQVFALFYKPAEGRADFDRLAELATSNAGRAARGLQPVIPTSSRDRSDRRLPAAHARVFAVHAR